MFFYKKLIITKKGSHLKRHFIDKLRVYVKSGDGGLGLPKLGGIGGDGKLFFQIRNYILIFRIKK
jgi:hypothetical protein